MGSDFAHIVNEMADDVNAPSRIKNSEGACKSPS
jgi:hypothetical protein